MRRLSGRGLAVVLVLTGCGTSHDLTATSVSGQTSPAPGTSASIGSGTSRAGHVPTAAGLRAALLTAGGLPSGYVAQPVPSGSSAGNSSTTSCPALASDPASAASAAVALVNAGSGSGVGELLMLVPAADAARDMARYAALPTSCQTFSAAISGLQVTFRAAPLAVTVLGDQTTATRFTGNVANAGDAITEDIVAIRRGRILMVITCSGVAPSTAFTERVAREAYAAVAARW
jgi:hypothetical protein